ncbi:FAD-binding oxidoreductase [Umezawaea sp. Da 62-37]|uniref:FAD-binding oxidoreductase n=1 Tax=Umezawaea sp. Da 62-37 TaxID=3075927 RepID=UPI0028F72DD6|nr:FAD-binding oxidoreductase [Umezawaea sp. Da 62-37]WNV87813.1 FAD-binding oxidoreductase [Umezawaea sp. Da 62-37]
MISRRTLLGAGAAAASAALVGTAAAAPVGTTTAADAWSGLRRGLAGDLVLPSDPRYDRARRLASAEFDAIRPRAVAQCETEADVSLCLRFAQDRGIPVTTRSGGHSFAGWSTGEGLVVDLSRMDSVRVGEHSVRLGPAAQAVDVVSALAPHGVTVPAGFCPTVCPGGFVTGGGMGWQFRKYGPASDRLLSARVVLADGRAVVASAERNPDLLWALRGGGGGNFGIVTDFEMKPTVEPSVVHFTLNWPWDSADTVLNRWQDWAEHTDAALAPRAGLLLDDAAPGAVPRVIVTGVHFGTTAEATAALDELVSLVGSPPTGRVVEHLSYERAMMRQFGCENSSVAQCHLTGANPEALLPRSVFVRHRSRMFADPVPASGVDDLLRAFDADRAAGQYRWLGFLSLGKNANTVPRDATAYVHRDATLFAVYTVGLADPTPEARAAGLSWVDGGFAAMDPHSNGRTYVNYPDTSLPDWRDAYYGSNHDRLVRVKRRYDPHGLFRLPHGVGA